MKLSISVITLIALLLFISGFLPAEKNNTPYHGEEPIDSAIIERYKSDCKLLVRSALVERIGYEWLREFCEIGPRLSGSENSLKAIRWAESRMKDLDFDSVWLQPVMVPHWKRGTLESALIKNSISYKDYPLSIISLGGSIPTDEKGITAPVIEVKNFDELKERGGEAAGKIVFFSRPLDQGVLNTFSGYGGAVDQRVYGAIEAAKYGAVAVLVRSVTTKFDNIPHTGVVAYTDSVNKIPAAAMGYLDSDLLSNLLKVEPDLKIEINLNCRILPDILSYNVIGEIRGSELPDEIIIVSGHIDSWDVGDGAHDDAAGCIQSIEILNLLKRNNIQLKRTIRCVLFINEENGSRGADEYAVYSDTSNEKIFAAIESDRGAFTPVGFTIENNNEAILKIQSWLPLLELAGIKWVRKGGSGADINRLKKAKLLIWYVPDDQRYMDVHHSANDVFEEVHPREFELGTAAMAILVYLLSEEF